MSRWNKEELENMLEDVVNELQLSDKMMDEHGPLGTPPATLVRLVLDQKESEIAMLRHGFKQIDAESGGRLGELRVFASGPGHSRIRQTNKEQGL